MQKKQDELVAEDLDLDKGKVTSEQILEGMNTLLNTKAEAVELVEHPLPFITPADPLTPEQEKRLEDILPKANGKGIILESTGPTEPGPFQKLWNEALNNRDT